MKKCDIFIYLRRRRVPPKPISVSLSSGFVSVAGAFSFVSVGAMLSSKSGSSATSLLSSPLFMKDFAINRSFTLSESLSNKFFSISLVLSGVETVRCFLVDRSGVLLVSAFADCMARFFLCRELLLVLDPLSEIESLRLFSVGLLAGVPGTILLTPSSTSNALNACRSSPVPLNIASETVVGIDSIFLTQSAWTCFLCTTLKSLMYGTKTRRNPTFSACCIENLTPSDTIPTIAGPYFSGTLLCVPGTDFANAELSFFKLSWCVAYRFRSVVSCSSMNWAGFDRLSSWFNKVAISWSG
mmetsp:Transcript_11713/g.21353  ORF Transcript_11713/g.21353 Transcript_11713/m.21353 type:complete len:298 (-) Transcript_11713:3039-3932(-)